MSFLLTQGFNFIFTQGTLISAERAKYINERGAFLFGYILTIRGSDDSFEKYNYYADESIHKKIGTVIYFHFLDNGNGYARDLMHIQEDVH